ncbi:hypothetical protein D3C76_1416540 [compost metagenome]
MRAVTKFVVRIPAYGFHFRFAHKVPAQVDNVNADIDQRAAARALLIREPAARIAEAPDQAGFGEINVP